MANTTEMRVLTRKWSQRRFWPKFVEWLEIRGIRGWAGQRITFEFPITVLVGENGSGKSTILQAVAACYKNSLPGKQWFASDFFPDTPWDSINNASLRVGIKEGEQHLETSIRKASDRWRGNLLRHQRPVYYIDLRRIQPLVSRSGYVKLANKNLQEISSKKFSPSVTQRLSFILNREYTSAKMAIAGSTEGHEVPVMERGEHMYSGFHQGAGEITATELLAADFEKYSLVIIDEIESSLHPRAQRRLMRDLAKIAEDREIQFIISTHSPYVLEEIHPDGRMLVMDTLSGKSLFSGVSPEFAMTSIDDKTHPECAVFVEDCAAKILVTEAVVSEDRHLIKRLSITPFGKAHVGGSLGLMVAEKRFAKPTVVFLDGDQTQTPGTYVLPGGDAPELVVFNALKERNWPGIAERLGRKYSEISDALPSAMLWENHHDWQNVAADKLSIPAKTLWQAMCACWVTSCMSQEELHESITQPILAALSKDKA